MELPRLSREQFTFFKRDIVPAPVVPSTTAIVDLLKYPGDNGVNQYIVTDMGVYPVTNHMLAENEHAAIAFDAPLPTRESVTNTLARKHNFKSPDILLGNNDHGAGRMVFNKGNPLDASFDPDLPSSRIHQALVLFEGSAPVDRLAAISETTVEEVIFHTQVKGVYEYDEGTSQIDSPALKAYLGELTDRGTNYQEIVLAPDIDTVEERIAFRAEASLIQQERDGLDKAQRAIKAFPAD